MRANSLLGNSVFKRTTTLPKVKQVYTMAPLEQLPLYWQDYFKRADAAIVENFWGNLRILERAFRHGDAYALQLQEIGYSFKEGQEKPAPFYQTVSWCLQKLQDITNSEQFSALDVLLPAKAFEVKAEGRTKIIFVPFGGEVPEGARELNLLPPGVFVEMLSRGYFPIGAPIREHTNQTLCEHDIAHIAGFIDSPRYMRAVRQAFQRVGVMMQDNPRIVQALQNFDSLYSLRLYYMIEVFSVIPEDKIPALEQLMGLKVADFSLDQPELIYPKIVAFLTAKSPADLNQYLYRLFKEILHYLDAYGGESRDLLNRVRKFSRGNQAGSFYATMSNLESKFDGSSIYSLILNAMAALENKRSNHKDYQDTIKLIYAPVLGALLGTCQLTVEDWVFSAIAETPDPNSKIHKYICQTGLWNRAHVLFHAYKHTDCTKVLTNDDFFEQPVRRIVI